MNNDRVYIDVAKTHVYTLKDAMDGYASDCYLEMEGKLVKLFKWDDSDDMYIPEGEGKLMLYKEHFDGPCIGKEEAMERYPEYFL